MKKYTIKDFLAGKVSIRCDNKEQQKAILKVRKENGIVWNGGEPIDNHFPDEPVLTVGFWGNGRLTHGLGKHPGMNVVDFSEIDLSTATRYQIVIESDGDTTTTKMIVNGKEVKQATAKRNPADKANFHVGAQVAFDRLWEKKEKPEKPAEKDGFKVGDRVVCVSDHFITPNSVGQHGRVVSFDKFGNIGVEFDGCQPRGHSCDGKAKSDHGRWLAVENLRNEHPTKQKVREVKRHAKVGEYVRITNKYGVVRCNYQNGEVHKVVKEVTDEMVRLSCGGVGAFDDEYVVLEGYQPGRDSK